MSLFKRIKNIIKSNLSFNKNSEIEDFSVFEEFDKDYYSDAKEECKTKNVEAEYYANLELEYGADFNKIKSAYRRLLKKYHPDLYQGKGREKEAELAKNIVKRLNEAYSYFEEKYNN